MLVETIFLTLLPLQLVVNAALGFDTFLVVRHGVRSDEGSMEVDEPEEAGPSTSKPKSSSSFYNISGSELGCYFCNDVVAPGDVRFLPSSDHVMMFSN